LFSLNPAVKTVSFVLIISPSCFLMYLPFT
jgi:hypothetical protein